jgi:hypothetical protein
MIRVHGGGRAVFDNGDEVAESVVAVFVDVVLRVAQVDELAVGIVAQGPALGGAAVGYFFVCHFSETVCLDIRDTALSVLLRGFLGALYLAVQVAVGRDDVAVWCHRLFGQARQVAAAVAVGVVAMGAGGSESVRRLVDKAVPVVGIGGALRLVPVWDRAADLHAVRGKLVFY